MSIEQRTARLTVLIDPGKKAVFEHLCAREDQTPSQVVRRLIRDYIEGHFKVEGEWSNDLMKQGKPPGPILPGNPSAADAVVQTR